MKWKAEYSIGLETIDRQHQWVFERMLDLENSIEKKDPRHIRQFFIEELANYLKFHFAVEEAMLEAIGYPGLKSHCAKHEHLIAAFVELDKKVHEQGSPADLVNFFEEWFVKHVLTDDRAYATYVRKMLPGLFKGDS